MRDLRGCVWLTAVFRFTGFGKRCLPTPEADLALTCFGVIDRGTFPVLIFCERRKNWVCQLSFIGG